MIRRAITATIGAVVLTATSTVVFGQGGKPASPAGTSATQVGGKYETPAGADEPVYTGGKWIEISYGRPIKRGRDLWGSGASYGKMLNAGAPVWRAGANVTTRLKTDVPLVINNKTVAPGEYSVFIDLKPNNWTFIVSNWAHQTKYDPNNKQALWGSYNYTPDKDVVRAPMTLGTLPVSVDQLTWEFVDMTDAGGKLAIMWDKTIASVPFTVGK
jgi:Protein of unknown function (DUF2911)